MRESWTRCSGARVAAWICVGHGSNLDDDHAVYLMRIDVVGTLLESVRLNPSLDGWRASLWPADPSDDLITGVLRFCEQQGIPRSSRRRPSRPASAPDVPLLTASAQRKQPGLWPGCSLPLDVLIRPVGS